MKRNLDHLKISLDFQSSGDGTYKPNLAKDMGIELKFLTKNFKFDEYN